MDKKQIIELSNFSIHYFKKLVQNIPEDKIYEKQVEGINSAGWIMGHLCAEATDLFTIFPPPIKMDYTWLMKFHNTAPKLQITKELPSKTEMLKVFDEFYDYLQKLYLNLTDEEMNKPCPGNILPKHFKSMSGSFHHHLTTHIFVHCGNLVVWKKLMNLPVEGY